MITSSLGINFIENEEGFREKLYKDIAGNWSIGFGHKCNPLDLIKYKVTGITLNDAKDLLINDLVRVEKELNQIAGLNQGQFDAVASFVYNIGITNFRMSTLRKCLVAKNWQGAAKEFPRWVHDNNKKAIVGLVLRRKRERLSFCRASGLPA